MCLTSTFSKKNCFIYRIMQSGGTRGWLRWATATPEKMRNEYNTWSFKKINL
jgi:hypothetical protein